MKLNGRMEYESRTEDNVDNPDETNIRGNLQLKQIVELFY